jgi:hypothetical protein
LSKQFNGLGSPAPVRRIGSPDSRVSEKTGTELGSSLDKRCGFSPVEEKSLTLVSKSHKDYATIPGGRICKKSRPEDGSCKVFPLH